MNKDEVLCRGINCNKKENCVRYLNHRAFMKDGDSSCYGWYLTETEDQSKCFLYKEKDQPNKTKE